MNVIINVDLLLSAGVWFDWLSWQGLLPELRLVIKKAEFGMPPMALEGWNFVKCRNRYQGLIFEFLLDGHGNVITVSFYVDKEVRDKIKEKQLSSPSYKANQDVKDNRYLKKPHIHPLWTMDFLDIFHNQDD